MCHIVGLLVRLYQNYCSLWLWSTSRRSLLSVPRWLPRVWLPVADRNVSFFSLFSVSYCRMAMKEKGDYDQMNNFLGLITCIFFKTLFFSFGLEAFSDNVRLDLIKEERKGQSIDQKEKNSWWFQSKQPRDNRPQISSILHVMAGDGEADVPLDHSGITVVVPFDQAGSALGEADNIPAQRNQNQILQRRLFENVHIADQ